MNDPYPPIADLLPHGPPMLALDHMESWSEGKTTTRLMIHEDFLFVKNGFVDSVMCLEYMAQSIAACLGYEACQSGEGIRVGMVIACRNMSIEVPRIPVGTELSISAERIRGSESLSHFRTETRSKDTLIAKATLTIYHAAGIDQS